jgi:hypothetical protein
MCHLCGYLEVSPICVSATSSCYTTPREIFYHIKEYFCSWIISSDGPVAEHTMREFLVKIRLPQPCIPLRWGKMLFKLVSSRKPHSLLGLKKLNEFGSFVYTSAPVELWLHA